MKSKHIWVFDGESLRKHWPGSHPDFYDPTATEVMALIGAVQLDAYRQGAEDMRAAAKMVSEDLAVMCDNAPWFGDIPDAIEALPIPEMPHE